MTLSKKKTRTTRNERFTEQRYSILQRKSTILKMLRRVFEPLTRLFDVNIFQPEILTSLLALMFAIAVGSKDYPVVIENRAKLSPKSSTPKQIEQKENEEKIANIHSLTNNEQKENEQKIANIQSLTNKFVDVAPLSDTIKTKIVKVLSNREYMNNIYKVANNIKQLSSFIFPIIGLSASVITALYFVKSKPKTTETKDDLKVIETVSKEHFDELQTKYNKLIDHNARLLSQMQEISSQLQNIQDTKQEIDLKIEQVNVADESELEKKLRIQMTTLRRQILESKNQLDTFHKKYTESSTIRDRLIMDYRIMVEDLRQTVSEMKSTEKTSSEQIQKLQKASTEIQSQLSQQQIAKQAIQEEFQKLQSQKETMQQNLTRTEEENSNLQVKIRDLESEIVHRQGLHDEVKRNLDTVTTSSTQNIEEKEKKIRLLENEMDQLKVEIQNLSKEFKENIDEKKQVSQSGSFEQIRDTFLRLKQSNVSLESKIEENVTKMSQLNQEKEKAVSDLEATKRKFEKQHGEFENSKKELQKEIESTKVQKNEIESKFATLKDLHVQQEKQVQSLLDLQNKLKQKEEELTQKEKNLSAELEKTKEQLESKESELAKSQKIIEANNVRIEQLSLQITESKKMAQEQKSTFDSQMEDISNQILLYNETQNAFVSIQEDRLNAEILETETKNEDIVIKLKALVKHATSNEKRLLQKMLEENQRIDKDLAQLKSEKSELQSEKSELETKKKQIEEQFNKLSIENGNMERLLQQMLQEKQTLEKKLAQLQLQKDELEKIVESKDELQSQIKNLQSEKQRIEEEKANIEVQYQQLGLHHQRIIEENGKLKEILQGISEIAGNEITIRSQIEQNFSGLVSYITQLQSNCAEMALQREQLIQSDMLPYFQMQLQMKISFLEKPANMFKFKNSGYYTLEKQSDGKEIVKFNEKTWVYFTSEISDDKKQAYVKFVKENIQHFLQKLYVMEKLLDFIYNLNIIFSDGFLEKFTNSVFKSDVHSEEMKSVLVDVSEDTVQKLIQMMTRYINNNRADSYANLQAEFLQEFLQNHNFEKTDEIVNLWMFLLQQTHFDLNFAANSTIREIKDVVFHGQNACEFYKQKSLRIESEPELMEKMMAEWLGISLEQLKTTSLSLENLPWNNRNDDNLRIRQLKTFVKALLPPNESNRFLISYIENCLKDSQNFKDWCILQAGIFDFYIYESSFDIQSLLQNEQNQTNIMIQIFKNVSFGDEKYFDDNINIVFISEVISVMIVDIYMNKYPAKEVDADIYNEDKIRDIRRQYIELFKIRLRGDPERQTLESMLQTYKHYFVVFFVKFYEYILRNYNQFIPLAIIATLYKIKISKPSSKITIVEAKSVFKKVLFRLVTWIMLLFFYRNSCSRPDEKIQQILTTFHDPTLQNRSSQSNPSSFMPIPQMRETLVREIPEMKDREELSKIEKRRQRELFSDESFTGPTKRRHIDENAHKENEEQKDTEEYGLAKISATMTNFFLYLISDVDIQIPDNMLCNSNLKSIKNLIQIYFAKLEHFETFWESGNHELEKILFGQSRITIMSWIRNISRKVQLPHDISIIQNL